jgi:hypothetical protein
MLFRIVASLVVILCILAVVYVLGGNGESATPASVYEAPVSQSTNPFK